MIDFFTSEAYSNTITRIKDLTGTACYLIEGKDKTCLVDTCYGCGSLKEYIENKLNKNRFSYFNARSLRSLWRHS